MRQRLIIAFLCALSYATVCFPQINTNRVMLMGRNALYYEDYVLAIQRFNSVISSKPYLAEPDRKSTRLNSSHVT